MGAFPRRRLDRVYYRLSEADQVGLGSPSQLKREIATGELRAYKLGRNVVIHIDDLLARLTPVAPVGAASQLASETPVVEPATDRPLISAAQWRSV